MLVPSAGCRHRDKGSGAIDSLVESGQSARNVSFGSVTHEPNHGRRTSEPLTADVEQRQIIVAALDDQ